MVANNKTIPGMLSSGKPKVKLEKLKGDVKHIVDLLVTDDTQRSRGIDGAKQAMMPSEDLLNLISGKTTSSINDNNSIFQLLPEIELSRQILVSSILSPNDLAKVELHITAEDSKLDPELTGALIDVLDQHFDRTYKIKTLLPNILSDCLFKTGSYPLLVLPHNVIDDVINSPGRVSVESLASELSNDGTPVPMGILGGIDGGNGKDDTFSLESFQTVPRAATNDGDFKLNEYTSLTDNPSIAKLPMVTDKLTQDRVNDVYSMRGVGVESYKKNPTPADIERSVYRQRRYSYVPILPLDDSSDNVDGRHPLVMKLPSESVIPVHVPSNPNDHIGYFVLLDQLGNPVSKALESDYYANLQSNIAENSDLASNILNQTMVGQKGLDENATPPEIAQMVRSYGDIIESKLLKSLSNGIYGDSVEVARPDEIYRIMLSRAMAKMQTRIMYVPENLMTYVAFDYNSYGAGKSLLEDSKILASIRAVLLFANTMSAVKNSVGRTGVKIELDPQDPDPNKTVEFLLSEYARTSRVGYPLGESNPSDLIDYLQKASINLHVAGHPAYPETSMEVEDVQSNRSMVDTDLEDSMKRRHIMSMGLSPESVDLSTEVEFATSVVNSNLMLSKRVMLYQDSLSEWLSDFVKKYVLHDGILMGKMEEAILSNRSKLDKNDKEKGPLAIIQTFLDTVALKLPSPDSATIDNQLEAFGKYNDALEVALDAYFNTEALDLDGMDDVSSNLDAVRSAVTAHYQRQWLRNNNMLPELQELTTFDDQDGAAVNLFDITENHQIAIGKTVSEFITSLTKAQAKREAAAEKALEETEDAGNDLGDGDIGDDVNATGDTDLPDDVVGTPEEPEPKEVPAEGGEPPEDEGDAEDDDLFKDL